MKPYKSLFTESGGTLIANSKESAMGLVSISNLEWEVEKDSYYWDWDDAKQIEKDTGGGWRLPTIQELYSTCVSKKQIRGFKEFKPDVYWSSTVYDDRNAWCMQVFQLSVAKNSKRSTCRVRLVREK